MPVIASLICGFIFGSGLVISGMVQTAKVLGFLDLLAIPSGNWDPSLVVVMAAGLTVTGIGYALIRPRAPIFTAQSHWPLGREIDRPLLTGAALFGVGWGLVGLCPGPAIADLATGSPGVVVFVVAMAVGMAVNDLWRLRAAAPTVAAASAADG